MEKVSSTTTCRELEVYLFQKETNHSAFVVRAISALPNEEEGLIWPLSLIYTFDDYFGVNPVLLESRMAAASDKPNLFWILPYEKDCFRVVSIHYC